MRKLGFGEVLKSPEVITHISYALHTNSLKLHTFVCEVLGAICMLSPIDGHKAVLSALSDFRIAYDESFRFETLLSTLRLPEDFDAMNDGDSVVSFADEDGIWDARVASMTLVNGLTNCPDDLEDRVLLREEFTRRGLSELLVVRPHCVSYIFCFDFAIRLSDIFGHPNPSCNKSMSIPKKSSRMRKSCGNAQEH